MRCIFHMLQPHARYLFGQAGRQWMQIIFGCASLISEETCIDMPPNGMWSLILKDFLAGFCWGNERIWWPCWGATKNNIEIKTHSLIQRQMGFWVICYTSSFFYIIILSHGFDEYSLFIHRNVFYQKNSYIGNNQI